MNEPPRTVRVFDRGAQTTVIIDFDGKYATLNFSKSGRFCVDALLDSEENSRYAPITNGDYFYVLAQTILRFFDSGLPPFDRAQTMSVIAIRDAVLKGKELPVGELVTVE